MEDVQFEVQPGEPAALPTRPRNRHKRERDVSHLCPTAVRLAQRKDELLRSWRDRSALPLELPATPPPERGKKSKTDGQWSSNLEETASQPRERTPEAEPPDADADADTTLLASSETDDSKDEEYTVSDEDDYSKPLDYRRSNHKLSNDSSEDEALRELEDSASDAAANVKDAGGRRQAW